LDDRVLVVNVPQFPDDLLRELIGDQPVVRSISAESVEELRQAVCDTNPTVVIIGVGAEGRAIAREFVREHARLRVLAVVDEGARGIVYDFESSEGLAGPLGHEGVQRLLRAAPGGGT
jgi:hypothetical protein